MRHQYLSQRGHQTHSLAAQRKGLAIICRISISHIKGLELRQGVLRQRTASIGSAFQSIIVKEDELVVLRTFHVDLDNIRAHGKSRGDRRQRIVDKRMRGRRDAPSGAGIIVNSSRPYT
jgi:hypothetical protein